MFLMCVVAAVQGTDTGTASTDIRFPGNGLNVNGTTTSVTADMPDNQYFGLWGQNDLLILLGVAVAVVGVASITIMGSGVSGLFQSILFTTTLYGGIWALVSLTAWDMLTDPHLMGVGVIAYGGLTLSYIMGLVSEARSGGDV
jgi:hypothetical protein